MGYLPDGLPCSRTSHKRDIEPSCLDMPLQHDMIPDFRVRQITHPLPYTEANFSPRVKMAKRDIRVQIPSLSEV